MNVGYEKERAALQTEAVHCIVSSFHWATLSIKKTAKWFNISFSQEMIQHVTDLRKVIIPDMILIFYKCKDSEPCVDGTSSGKVAMWEDSSNSPHAQNCYLSSGGLVERGVDCICPPPNENEIYSACSIGMKTPLCPLLISLARGGTAKRQQEMSELDKQTNLK